MVRDEFIELLKKHGACDEAILYAQAFHPDAKAENIALAYVLDTAMSDEWATWAMENLYEAAPELRDIWISKLRPQTRKLMVAHLDHFTEEDRDKIWNQKQKVL